MRIATWWRAQLWWVRWITYMLILVSLFYGVEDLRGYLALERAKDEYIASGLRLDLDEIRGPVISDEENFAASEMIREIYSDPYSQKSKIFADTYWPHRYPDATGIRYHGSLSIKWEYSDHERKEAYEQSCHDALEAIAPQLRRFINASKRPSCDWWSVSDPTDNLRNSHHSALIIDAGRALRLYYGIPETEISFPVSKAEMIIGILAAAKHVRTNSCLHNQMMGSGCVVIGLHVLTDGIRNRAFTHGELDSISERLESLKPKFEKEFIEFETAMGFARYAPSKEGRRIYLGEVEYSYGTDLIVEFPELPFEIDLNTVEESLNKMIVAISPRGWIWQGHAHQVRTLLGATTSKPSPLYAFFSFGDATEDLGRMIESEEWLPIATNFAILAIEIEKHRLENGTLPAKDEFKTNSPNIGYTIEENGQPMLWYSEELPLGSAPTGKALEDYNEKHLWRYPPPES